MAEPIAARPRDYFAEMARDLDPQRERELEEYFRGFTRDALARYAARIQFTILAGGRAAADLSIAQVELEDERQRVELFKGLFDRAMSFLERLGGNELPELVKLRAEAARVAPLLSQPDRLRAKRVRRDEELLPRVVALVLAREVTKTIATKLGCGEETVKRVRAEARRRGLLPGRRTR